MPREDGQNLVDDMRSLINKLDQLTREIEARLLAYNGPQGVSPKSPYGDTSGNG
jgi:hypothetical protein